MGLSGDWLAVHRGVGRDGGIYRLYGTGVGVVRGWFDVGIATRILVVDAVAPFAGIGVGFFAHKMSSYSALNG